MILAAILTINVLSAFEETLEAVISLALFIPLLIYFLIARMILF